MYAGCMAVQRGYRDACGMAHALDLIGERWALLVVRELLLGPKRFTDLRRGLPAASPNALSDRLRDLTEIGVVRRRRLQPPAASWVYELTDWGRELEPILISLGTWAIRSSRHDDTGYLSVDSLMLTIRTYFRADAARTGTVEVRLGEDRFGVWLGGAAPDGAGRRGAPAGAGPDGAPGAGTGGTLGGPTVDVRHEVPDRPDVVLTSDAATLSGVFGDRAAARAALGDGIDGGIGVV